MDPVFGTRDVHRLESDLTIQGGGKPIGERTVVTRRIVDGEGRPVRRQLAEIWRPTPPADTFPARSAPGTTGPELHRRDAA